MPDHTLPAPATADDVTPSATDGSDTNPIALVEADPDLARLAPPGYEIVRELGRGGMGVVYLARHAELGRQVALKVVLAGGHASPADLARFQREAEAAAKLQHPNVVQVYEVGRHDGRPYFTLEYVDGGSLASYARDPLPPREAAGIVEQVARGMAFAHANGIVHRDLKPDNVLLASGGRELPVSSPRTGGSRPPLAGFIPKVTDFGLAKSIDADSSLTATGAVMGTPSYMAPEQALGTVRVGPPADTWALGALLYRLLTGRPPFAAPTPHETIHQVIVADPPAPSSLVPRLPRDLETICLRCLRKSPSQRYPSAEALADDLKRFLAGEPIHARPVGSAERAWKWVKRNRGPTASAALVFLALAVGAGVALWQAVVADAARADAVDAAGKARIAEGVARDRGQKEAEARADADRQKGAAVRQKEAAEKQERTTRAVKDYLQTVLTQAAARGQGSGRDPADPTRTVKADLTVKEAMRYAAAQLDGQFPDQPLLEIELRNTIGQTFYELGAYPEAETQLQQARAVAAAAGQAEHPTALVTLGNLALVYKEQAKYDEAEPLYIRVLAGFEKEYGPDHVETSRAAGNLAALYRARQQYDKAEPLYLRALAGFEKTLPPTDPHVLRTMNNLAVLYRAQQKNDRAEPLLLRVLAAQEKAFPPNHPDMLYTLSNLAIMYGTQGRSDKAEPLLVRVVAGREKVLGPDHKDTLTATTDLAIACKERREYTRAEILYDRALAGFAKTLPPEHPEVLRAVNALATMYATLGRFARAEPLYRRVLAGREKVFPPSDTRVLSTRNSLAGVYENRKKFPQAEAQLRPLVAVYEKRPGPTAWATAAGFRLRLGRALSAQGKHAEAAEQYRAVFRSVDRAGQVQPSLSQPRLREAAVRLVGAYEATGNPAEAAKWRAEAAKHREAAPPPRPAR